MEDILQKEYWSGYGVSSLEQVMALQKALTSNPGVTDVAQLYGGMAFAPQSLEKTLVRLSFSEEHIKLYKRLKAGAMKANNTVEEYRMNDGYDQTGGWVGEMENPEAGDVSVRSAVAQVKFTRELWRVSDVLEYTQQITPAVAEQQHAAMMRLLRNIEKTIFFGDSAIIPQQFNGLKKSIETNATSDHTFDLRGTALPEAVLKQAAELIFNNFGMPKTLYISPSVQTGLDSLLAPSANGQRLVQNMPGLEGLSLGHSASKMITSFGTFNFEPDIFIAKESWGVPTKRSPSYAGTIVEGATSLKAPSSPIVTGTVVPPTVTGSKWQNSGYSPAGAYRYRVAAINQYGKSKACDAVGAFTVAATGAITLTIKEVEGQNATLGYEIYRESAPGLGDYKYVTTIGYTAPTMTWTDLNEDLPGTGIAFLIDDTTTGDRRVLSLGELAPIYSKEYAPIAPYRWGALNYYVNMKIYAPLRMVMIKNILVGTYSGANPLINL